MTHLSVDREQRLRDLKASQPDLPVVLRGERTAQYEKIMAVLDICARVGIQSIGLAAQRVVVATTGRRAVVGPAPREARASTAQRPLRHR